MKAFDFLNKDTEIFGKHFIKASAGTGKTFAIEHILVRLIIEKKYPLFLDQILIVTFTNAAIRDLKIRIRKTIEKSIYDLENENIDAFDYLKPYFKKKEKTLALLNLALDSFEQAQIFTIHSFCYFALKTFFFEGKEIFNLTDEIFYQKNLEVLIMDYFQYFIDLKKYNFEQFFLFLKKHNKKRSLLENFENFSIFKKKDIFQFNFLKKFNKELLKFKKKNFSADVFKDFDNLEKFYKKIKNVESIDLKKQLKLFVNILEKKKCNKKEFEEILKTKATLFQFLSDSNKKKKNFSQKLLCPYFFEFSKKNIYALIQKSLDINLMKKNLSYDISVWIKKNLKEEDIFNPDHVLIKIDKALDNKSFIKNLKDRYRAIIIDEFQDTDPIQWNIFKKTFFNCKAIEAFYLIGDPKQSIYSFRNADLYTYFKALKSFDASSISCLDTNFRSHPKLVKALNNIFSEEFSSNWLKLPKLEKNIKYTPLNFVDKKESGKEKGIHFFIGKESVKTKRVPSSYLEEEVFFPYIAKEIFKIKENIKSKEIAILVKDRYQANRIKRFFKKNNLKAFSKGALSLSESHAAKAFSEILSAVIYPKDINKIKIAMLGEYISSDLREENIEEMVLKFCYLNTILKEKNLSSFFREFLNTKWGNESVSERIIKKDLFFYFDTIQIMELFLEEENKNRLTNNKILNFLKEDLKKSSSFFDDAVQILTIHMSKGLEFDVVFALGVICRTINSTEEDYEEANSEKLRQLYVAATRARKRLYIPIVIDKKEIPLHMVSPMELFLKKRLDEKGIIEKLEKLGGISYEFLSPSKIKPFFTEESSLKLKYPLSFKLYEKENHIYSFSSISENRGKRRTILKEKREEILFSSENLPLGKEIGSIVHEIFEKLLSGRYENFFDEKIIEEVIEEVVIKGDIKKNILKIMVKRALFCALFEDGSAIKDILHYNFFTEMEFFFGRENYMKGFIDLIFFHKGKYYILDWKTNYLGEKKRDYNRESLKRFMEEQKYFLQAFIYKEALENFLKTIEKKDFKDIFGGIYYIFLRGLLEDDYTNGIYYFYPENSFKDILCKEKNLII
ncbi:MAG: hypothetical protein AMS24_02155 [Chlamydiae bacterium SM23_39]|nr:MAG: hypothetical protein AMS24_02155 [Chlamydiae bacterium SM23_39]